MAMYQLDEILEITALSKRAKALGVLAHTNFNSLLLHFVALKEVHQLCNSWGIVMQMLLPYPQT